MFILEMLGDFEFFEFGYIKYWFDYFGQVCNGLSILFGS